MEDIASQIWSSLEFYLSTALRDDYDECCICVETNITHCYKVLHRPPEVKEEIEGFCSKESFPWI